MDGSWNSGCGFGYESWIMDDSSAFDRNEDIDRRYLMSSHLERVDV